MSRRLTPLVFVATLLLPLGPTAVAAQGSASSDSRRASAGTAEAAVFRKALEEIGARHREAFSDSALWSQALDGLIESLNDPYASVFTPEEVEQFDESNTGNYTGIGIQITLLNDRVTVTAVFRSTPAEQAGILVGDVIVGVDDENTADWSTSEVSRVVRGPPDSKVRVSVERDGLSEPIPFVLTRAEVHRPAVEAAMLDSGIGYVTVERVAENSAQEVDSVLRMMGAPRGLVLDLRRNPGGFLDESLMMADVFLEPGQKLASLRSRAVGSAEAETRSESWDDRVPARVPDVPIVVLVDEFTASAAEIVAGALQDYDRALVIGARTFGKGVVQTVVDLPYKHKLRLTTGTWHTPLGRSLHRPRDAEGRPLEEDIDTFPRVQTPGGRELYAAGGIFPDLEVANDTLRAAERKLLRMAGEAEVPLGIRIQEFAFDQARALSEAGQPPRLDGAAFDVFKNSLVDEGVPAEALEDPVAREYLAWRLRFSIADRMDDRAASIEYRMERDPVMRAAMDLLEASASQTGLFSAAREAADEGAESTGEEAERAGDVGEAGGS